MTIVKNILTLSIDYLSEKKVAHPRHSAEAIVAYVLKCNVLDLILHYNKTISTDEKNLINQLIARRGDFEPLEYIFQKIDFYDCSIMLTQDVLIPRQETEILVDKIIKYLSNCDVKGKVLWDICCGSGCIGIAIKKHLPDLTVIMSDVSPSAVLVAKKNVGDNNVDIEVKLGDLTKPYDLNKIDFIVSNPPYVTKEEYDNVPKEVQYEPKLALIGGSCGLEYYKRLAKSLLENNNITVFLEIGKDQGYAVKDIFLKYCKKEGTVYKDWSGNDRFFFLENE
jgi:release factor glutamine methyltransferase